jgi:biopolymer transport protein TolQ
MHILFGAGINYLEAVFAAGPVGILVLLVLLAASVTSWGIIVRKSLQLRTAQSQSVAFLETFWQSKRLDEIYSKAEGLKESPVSQVFRAGYVELAKLTGDAREGKVDGDGLENIERSLRRAANAELTHLEGQVSFLGTTASAAPFVGLFGTVWGIMRAFNEIYEAGNANLGTVAKPISEALIATAVGLFAAIPAVVAYNYFVARIHVLESEMSNFASDFLNIIKRHFVR